MKKILNVFVGIALFGGVTGCETVCSKYCENSGTVGQDSVVTNNSASKNSSELEEEINLFNATFNAVEFKFDDGSGDGHNICLSLDYLKGEGIFQLLTFKEGKIEKSTPATWKLDGKSYIEFLMFKDAFGETKFSYQLKKSQDPLTNAAFLRIPSADGQKFSLKLGDSVSSKVLASATKDYCLALIGGQDTREDVVETSYVSANLEKDTVRVHAVKDAAANRIVLTFSSDEPIVKASGSKRFPIADIGIPSWKCSEDAKTAK